MAKKAESTLKNMFLSLTAIALVAAALLAFMNAITEEPIEIAKENKVNKAIADVLQQVDENGDTLRIPFDTIVDVKVMVSTNIDDTVMTTTFDTLKNNKIIKVVRIGAPCDNGKYKDSVVCHIAYKDSLYVGAAVESMDFNGFGGVLKIMVGYDADGNIYGYSILESHETPGLGAKADNWFQKGNKGNIIGQTTTTELKVKKDKGTVDAITGSTITSRAFLRGVNKAYKYLNIALTK